jgi:hypothetical protein
MSERGLDPLQLKIPQASSCVADAHGQTVFHIGAEAFLPRIDQVPDSV